MKSVAVQKAVNVIKSGSWTSPFDGRYLDETSQFKFDCDRIGAQKRGQSYTPKPWESLPYLAKDDLGRIHVRGFLHDLVAGNPNGTFSHPTSLSTEEVIRRLSRVWRTHAQKNRETQVTHHRLVFSISGEFHDALTAAGRNPDMALRGVIERSMRAFQDKFHRGDSVGYTYGIHHDTDNLHAHVFIHPRTRDGAFIGMSGKPAKHQGHASRHKDQLGFLRENVRRRVTEVLKEISDPKEAAYLRHNIHSDRIFFVPRQSHTSRPRYDYRPRTPVDYQLEQKRAAVVALDRHIAARKAARSEAAVAQNIASLFRLRQPKWIRLLQQAQAAKQFREMRELQAQRYRLWAEYREARRRLIPGPQATKTVPKRRKKEATTPAVKPAATLKPATVKPTVTVRPKARKPGHQF
jgi:hypothetical protein